MGIFSRLFKSRPDPNDPKNWNDLACAIDAGLKMYRQQWFSSCVAILKERMLQDKDLKVVNTQLSGVGDIAIKAYQLYIVSSFLTEQNYIVESIIKDFLGVLCKQVCGTDLDACMVYLNRYIDAGDESQQVFRFSSDVATHITGNDNPTHASLAVTLNYPDFAAYNRIIVAHFFDDIKKANELKDNLKKYYEKETKA